MDYSDLLDGLVPDLDADALPDPPDLPAELVLVEDGEVNVEQVARFDYLRDYAVMIYGTAVLEPVETDEDSGRLVVYLLDPTEVTITVENDIEVRRDGEIVENAYVESHSGEQEHYGDSPVEEAAEANILDDLILDRIALASEEDAYENSSLGPVEDHGEQ